jgi:hypothetical protein
MTTRASRETGWMSGPAELRGDLLGPARRGHQPHLLPPAGPDGPRAHGPDGARQGTIRAFPPATSCETAPASLPWLEEPASDRLWATPRDGDVVLVTTGDGAFQRE